MNNENKKEEASLYKLQNCMWTELVMNPFSFHCQLRNINTNDLKEAIIHCNKCANFQDTNLDIDGGFLG